MSMIEDVALDDVRAFVLERLSHYLKQPGANRLFFTYNKSTSPIPERAARRDEIAFEKAQLNRPWAWPVGFDFTTLPTTELILALEKFVRETNRGWA